MKRFPPNEKLLDAFRKKQKCEKCCRVVWGCHPHHILGRGMGGARRIDHPKNLVALCCQCHQAAHFGKISKAELLAIVAKREGCTPEQAEAAINQIRRHYEPK